MSDLHEYLEQKKREVNQALDLHLPGEETRPARLHEAMRYTVFAGGKRLRPALCLAACEAVGGTDEAAMLPAIALEILHTYTLVHDDLPAMDDDDLRRGMPTAHIKYGEALAILTGDALLTLAFQWLAECEAPPPYVPNQLSLELAAASGSQGIIAGQVEDLAAEGVEPDQALVDYIHLHKTAALFRASIRIGAICGSARSEELDALTLYGCNLGLAFQIVDDILDETSTDEELGKPIGSDREKDKATYVALLGIDAARKKAETLIESAMEQLKGVRHPDRLQQIAERVLSRSN
ncbi:MAG: polyprenyl synthetase family protein [Verrucomicrobiota bacterium]